MFGSKKNVVTNQSPGGRASTVHIYMHVHTHPVTKSDTSFLSSTYVYIFIYISTTQGMEPTSIQYVRERRQCLAKHERQRAPEDGQTTRSRHCISLVVNITVARTQKLRMAFQ